MAAITAQAAQIMALRDTVASLWSRPQSLHKFSSSPFRRTRGAL